MDLPVLVRRIRELRGKRRHSRYLGLVHRCAQKKLAKRGKNAGIP